MTDEQINIAILEHMGWRFIASNDFGQKIYEHKYHGRESYKYLPNSLSNLYLIPQNTHIQNFLSSYFLFVFKMFSILANLFFLGKL